MNTYYPIPSSHFTHGNLTFCALVFLLSENTHISERSCVIGGVGKTDSLNVNVI